MRVQKTWVMPHLHAKTIFTHFIRLRIALYASIVENSLHLFDTRNFFFFLVSFLVPSTRLAGMCGGVMPGF